MSPNALSVDFSTAGGRARDQVCAAFSSCTYLKIALPGAEVEKLAAVVVAVAGRDSWAGAGAPSWRISLSMVLKRFSMLLSTEARSRDPPPLLGLTERARSQGFA